MHDNTLRAGLLVAGLALVSTTQAQAQDASPLPGTFTGNIAIVSDYIVRGISLSNQNPAIQGGFDWDSGTGIYAGSWAQASSSGTTRAWRSISSPVTVDISMLSPTK